MAAKRSASKNKTAKKKSAAKPGKAAKSRTKAQRKKSRGQTAAAVVEPAGGAEPVGQTTRVQHIQAIIDVMLAAGAVELETDDGAGGRLRVRLKEDLPPNILTTTMAAPAMAPHANFAGVAANAADLVEAAAAGEAIASPMVGTFYRAASPEAEPFIEVGDSIEDETTICIIEAMKVMNEIKAEMHGRIIEVLVESGEPVEFGQPLFRVTKG